MLKKDPTYVLGAIVHAPTNQILLRMSPQKASTETQSGPRHSCRGLLLVHIMGARKVERLWSCNCVSISWCWFPRGCKYRIASLVKFLLGLIHLLASSSPIWWGCPIIQPRDFAPSFPAPPMRTPHKPILIAGSQNISLSPGSIIPGLTGVTGPAAPTEPAHNFLISHPAAADGNLALSAVALSSTAFAFVTLSAVPAPAVQKLSRKRTAVEEYDYLKTSPIYVMAESGIDHCIVEIAHGCKWIEEDMVPSAAYLSARSPRM
jgi:hypothetical protein